jgi:hypothetical protein
MDHSFLITFADVTINVEHDWLTQLINYCVGQGFLTFSKLVLTDVINISTK